MGWSLRLSFSNQFPGDRDAAGLGPGSENFPARDQEGCLSCLAILLQAGADPGLTLLDSVGTEPGWHSSVQLPKTSKSHSLVKGFQAPQLEDAL